jgi:peptidoglycan hydrolase-like protein with peptidoglycan-binding domain
MDSERVTEIQQALIQAHYLSGSPTGTWDGESQAAMLKYQADNGWQSKIAPDSRALIKLGLGPKQDAGEYANAPAAITKDVTPTGTLNTVANSTMPSAATTQN